MKRPQNRVNLIQPLEPRRLMAAGNYTLIDLGKNVTVNDVAGVFYAGTRPGSGNKDVAFYARLTDPNNPILLSPITGKTQSEALAIAANGDVVGVSYTNNPQTDGRATLWSAGTAFDLGNGAATAISSNGIIVGYSPAGNNFQAARFAKNTVPVLLGDSDVQNSLAAAAAGVNANGTIVGGANNTAFSLANGSYFDLTFQGAGTTGRAEAINNFGSITGQIDSKAFFTSGSNIVQYLSTPNGSTSVGEDINTAGVIVGKVNSQAALWQDNTVYSLQTLVTNSSGWTLSDAQAISDEGRIIGSATNSDGTHGIALVPGGTFLNTKGTMTINASDFDDSITVNIKNGRFRVQMNGSTVTFSPKKVKRLSINSLGGDDVVALGSGVIGVGIDGGAGNDTISGGDNSDNLFGGTGNDKLTGYGGRDSLRGGDGNDTLLGGSSIDTLDGGNGTDKSDFDQREKRKNIEGLV